ncbi:MAG: hypothetical protein JNM67_11985 [Bacteroidetes bacterium]|nr:hypothetical protein [Bacteroidota bacterium]
MVKVQSSALGKALGKKDMGIEVLIVLILNTLLGCWKLKKLQSIKSYSKSFLHPAQKIG